jgi:transposase
MKTKLELQELREHAIALRRAGKSRSEIKEILGVGNSTLDPALRGEPPPLWTLRPRAKDELHAKARELRAGGATYDEIAGQLGVSKGSVSLWVRDMPRSGRISYEEFRKRNAEGVRRYWAVEHARREALRQEISDHAAAEIGALSDRELVIAGAIAYWCEGAKRKPYADRNRVTFINSDPGLISLFLRFLASNAITPDRLICRVHIHESADVAGAQRFWQEVTDLPAGTFRQPTLKRHNVRRSSRIYRQIEGWASAAMSAPSLPDTGGIAKIAPA